MIQGLYRRLAVVLLLIFLVLGALLFWLYEYSSQSLQRETSQKMHLHLAEYLVQDIGLYTDGELDHGSVKEAFSKVMKLDPATELYVLDPQGKVLAYDAPDAKIKNRQVDLEPIKEFLKNKNSLPVVGDDPRTPQQKIFSVAPILDENGSLQGYLYIIIGGEIYDNIATAVKVNKTWRFSLAMIGAALVFLLLTALLLFYTLTRPLARLGREISLFEKSGFTQLPEQAQQLLSREAKDMDELDQMRGSFYRMGQQIIRQLEYLQKHDQLRREFLAHVSHDLRTPLAGMRAYLETLQLGGSEISESTRQEFLEKALLTNTRLESMIYELFELARLEHGEIELHPENIVISDLLSDLYASLSSMANDKGIHLDIKMQENNISVYADVARIDRVLQNLVSNAIHYTSINGTVTVNVTLSEVDSQQVIISVKDTGQGIGDEELPYIFEPYFRSSNRKNVYKEGRGLGLAIAQRLLALHGSNLEVKSEFDHGTEFSFVLPHGKESLISDA
jgi:signal transduction histidine kinase